MAIYRKHCLVVISDPGEEVDDEMAALYAALKTKEEGSVCVEFLCVGGKIDAEKRIRRLQTLLAIDQTEQFRYGTFSDGALWAPNCQCTFVLQIGPIEDPAFAERFVQSLDEYDYFLLGRFGTTNSAGEKAGAAARCLYSNATRKWILSTKSNGCTRIPPFTAQCFTEDVPLDMQHEVLRVAYQNTVARAPPQLKHLTQLVSPGGANYETIQTMYNCVCRDTSKFEFLVPSMDARIAAQEFAKDGFNKDELDGLGKIVMALSELFHLPESCVLCSNHAAFRALATDTHVECDSSVYTTIYNGFSVFKKLATTTHAFPLTPAYDPIAMLAAFQLILNPVSFHTMFEKTGTGDTWQLCMSFCVPEVVSCMYMFPTHVPRSTDPSDS